MDRVFRKNMTKIAGLGNRAIVYKLLRAVMDEREEEKGGRRRMTPVLNSLGWPRIEALVAQRDAEKVFKVLKVEGAPRDIRDLFTHRLLYT